MITFDFSAFMQEFALNRKFCAKVFGVSERTITRWRVLRKIPRSAMQMVESIRLACPPWAIGFKRSHWSGICQIPPAWRDYLFAPPGGVWQDYRAPVRPNQPPSLRLTALTMITSKAS